MSASRTISRIESPSIATVKAVLSRGGIVSTPWSMPRSTNTSKDAIAREKEIKGWRRAKKDALVESLNPTWADLLEVSVARDPSLRWG
jgi:putative endonuclease